MKPMKGHPFKRDKQTFPCLVQPKLNGIRALWDGYQLYSNDEQVWFSTRLPYLFNVLRTWFQGQPLDGELYCHGMPLQEINRRVAVMSKTAHRDHMSISYHVFDIPIHMPQHRRLDELTSLERGPAIRVVESYCASDLEYLDMAHKYFRGQGYEGSMVRDYYANYGFKEVCSNKENRWGCLRKRKDWLDVVAVCIGITEGEGKYTGMVGALQLQLQNGVQFNASAGLSDAERLEYFLNPPIGKSVAVDFEELSADGVPMRFKKVQVKDWA